MEPVATAAAGVRAAGPVLGAGRRLIRRMRRLGTYELDWLFFDDSPGAGLSATEVSDIKAFLASDPVRPLLSLLAIVLMGPECDERNEALSILKGAFISEAKRWSIDQNQGWQVLAPSIWDEILAVYKRGVPASSAALHSAAAEFTDFISTPLGTSADASEPSSVRYMERLRDLASEISRVNAAVDCSEKIREAVADSPVLPIITYTETMKPATFAELYVARSLTDVDNEGEISSSALAKGEAPFRLVVQGAPGAGKSTFVRHLRQELSSNKEQNGVAPLLLTIRHYFTTSRAQTIHEYLHDQLRTSLNLEFEVERLRDALTLGLAIVIFDGLDEITDINQRNEMVERIVSFAREYPAVSILVTSRSVGYQRAPLPNKIFDTLTLSEYTLEQTTEYVERWFKFIEREDLVPEFLRESETVMDLRSNPLLLSLLCVLYRQRGSIPRRRRDIYASCADLLFHTWDSHRHIGQPEELHANGDRIMQEIARWVYNSQAAQSGLSESVIQKCIGIYLKDTVGVQEGEARRRASEFLEFCASRAWLLANVGSQHGERLFGFTHRTFFEFFAAEAFARQSSSADAVAAELEKAHRQDATSVLPELLLQSFDEKVDRGAAECFKTICSRENDDVLILRLMEGVPLPGQARHLGFSKVLDLWRRDHEIDEASVVALLSLNQDARNQFVEEFVSGEFTEEGLLFVSLWASLDLAGKLNRFKGIWRDDVLKYVDANLELFNAQVRSKSLQLWLWQQNRAPEPPNNGLDCLVIESSLGPRIGPLGLIVEIVMSDPAAVSRPDVTAVAATADRLMRRRSTKLGFGVGFSLAGAAKERWYHSPPKPSRLELPDGDVKWAVVYFVALLAEVGGLEEGAEWALRTAFGADVAVLLDSREHALGGGIFERSQDLQKAEERLRGFPLPLRMWAKAGRSFVAPFGGS